MPYTTLRDHAKGICHRVGAGHSTVCTQAEEQEIVVTCQVSNIKATRTEEFPFSNNPHEQIHMNTEILCIQLQVRKIS